MISIEQFFQIVLGFGAWLAIITLVAAMSTVFLGFIFSIIEWCADLFGGKQ